MLYKIKTELLKYENIDQIKDLLVELEENKERIIELDFSLNTFIPEIFKSVAAIIKKMKKLKKIKMESTFDSLNYEEMCKLVEILVQCLPKDLLVLDLNSNALSCKFPDILGEFISSSKLIEINLYNCGLGFEGLVRLNSYLEKIENKKNLRSLNLGKNRINNLKNDFGKIINLFPNLKILKIPHNTILEGMDDFLKSLDKINLETIDLSDNFIEEAQEFNNLFNRMNLKEIYLKDIKTEKMNEILKNMLNKEDFIELGQIKSKNEIILDISENDIEDQYLKLVEDLAKTYKIKKLIIFDNFFEDLSNLKEIVKNYNGEIIEENPLYSEIKEEEITGNLKLL